jgi:hypothetical protein
LSCCCSLGESILPSAAEQLRERRAHWLELEHECTKQALIALERRADPARAATTVSSEQAHEMR